MLHSAIYRNSPQNTAFFPNKKQAATLVKYRKRKIIENKCCFFSGFYYLSVVARNKAMKTTYGTKIDKIISQFDNIAVCQVGCEIVHIHISNIIK